MKQLTRLSAFVFVIVFVNVIIFVNAIVSCIEPPLHLYNTKDVNLDIPVVDLDLQVYWDYEMSFDISYDWEAEWHYGWDDTDLQMFGELGYSEPTTFNLRRYYTGDTPMAPHTSVIAATVNGTHFQGMYDWGFWDILCWNDIKTIDGIRSLVFDETTTLDSVVAYTNQSMRTSRYQAPQYTHAFHTPEALFAAYDRGIEINRDLEGFEYDEARNMYVKKLDMMLMPITFIYLTQVIIHNNRGRVVSTDGTSDLSGMARSTTLNTGRAGSDAITIYYHTRLKKDCDMNGEMVDIIGGRLMTFGMCNQVTNNLSRASDVTDGHRHYMDVNMQFINGKDSTLVFDVTDQIRERYKGGVITVELDMDTIPMPARAGGSGFDAVVKPVEDGGTHEFEM